MRRLVDIVGLRRQETEKPSLPQNTVVFAIGDIHGRIDLLVKIHQEILKQAKDIPSSYRKIAVYMGDYIDYGPDSADVIDTLISASLPGFKSVYLLGNHDLALISFLKGKREFLKWSKTRVDRNEELPQKYLVSESLSNWLYQEGGIQTLQSYGVDCPQKATPEGIAQMRVDLLRKIPQDHLVFLENLALSFIMGDFFFVHAGVDPKRTLDNQKPSDLLNIRTGFLEEETVLEKIIVHGHTPYKQACIRPNRIGIDTDAWLSGMLTSLMITKDRFKIIHS